MAGRDFESDSGWVLVLVFPGDWADVQGVILCSEGEVDDATHITRFGSCDSSELAPGLVASERCLEMSSGLGAADRE